MEQFSSIDRQEMEAHLKALDVSAIASAITKSLNDVSRNEGTKAMIQYISEYVVDHGAERGAAFVVAVANCVDSVQGLHGVTFSLDHCQLQMAAAACCAQLKAFTEALQLDARLLRAPGAETSRLAPPQRLALARRAMECAVEVDDKNAGELAARFGAPAFRSLSKESTYRATDLTDYLLALLLSLISRGRLLEASWAAHQRYLATRDHRDLEMTVSCAILSGAGPARTSLVNLLHATAEAADLGPLFTVLERVHATLLLEEADIDVAVGALNVRCLHSDDVRRALVEHNMTAASRFYDSIRIKTLCRLLGDLPEAEVLNSVVDMVLGGRLTARVDEASGFVFFRVMESKSALAEWDARIGAICSSVSYAGDLIADCRPELYAYAQSTKGN